MKSAAEPVVRARAEAHPRRMLDRYEILAEIAQGGMGTVYLARLGGAGGFERLFAVKLMHEHLAQEETFVTMLLDEARTAAHIHHPNAVGIIDVRESPVGYYLVMNYVDGFSLAQLLDHPALQREERIRIATRLVADAAHGLHAAHTAKSAKGEKLGIVHRDVSPQNILVGTDGMGRIVDFGIALAASRVAASRPGMLKGKPSYMAPEQARGEACDPRADVFALGIVLWEALTGARLFYADMDIATLVKVMECVVEPPTKHVPELPDSLSAMVMKALQRDAKDRYATARDMAIALERAAESAGLLASAHEVEEVIARLFESEIATRQDAVTKRLAESTGPEQPLDRVGLASISRLIPRPRRDDVSVVESSGGSRSDADLPATRASRPGVEARSGVRQSAVPRTPVSGMHSDVDAHASTRLSDRPDATSPVPLQSAPDATRSRALIGAAIAVTVLAIGGAIAVALSGGEEAAAPAPVVAPAAAAAPAVEPPPAPVVEPAPVQVEAPVPAPVVEAVAPAVEAVAPVVEAPAAPRAPRTRRATIEPASPSTPSAPQLETNPYLTH
ncbi:serine/threonine-protein kinase [Sandaracinus amylolyticus]|uniref:Serine/threonine protein kinase n=1 Tax=Sandaracinus amylolyticus TaxID=927083 RepID=A0A0F6W538_9BACT|nr:serine/threonine-protein kinase [Sandaracinus amylolyticus]AKF07648.1 serine/threonine protein kinase [Sandaracinus amylolyticus]